MFNRLSFAALLTMTAILAVGPASALTFKKGQLDLTAKSMTGHRRNSAKISLPVPQTQMKPPVLAAPTFLW